MFVISSLSRISLVSVSATATQTDLAADRGPKGWGRGEGAASIPVRVEFTENGLTYLDRLLLKKHPRYMDRQQQTDTHAPHALLVHVKACWD